MEEWEWPKRKDGKICFVSFRGGKTAGNGKFSNACSDNVLFYIYRVFWHSLWHRGTAQWSEKSTLNCRWEPGSPAEICSSSVSWCLLSSAVPVTSWIIGVAPEVLSGPWFPVDGAEVFQARPNMSFIKLVCTKPQVHESLCSSKCPLRFEWSAHIL